MQGEGENGDKGLHDRHAKRGETYRRTEGMAAKASLMELLARSCRREGLRPEAR